MRVWTIHALADCCEEHVKIVSIHASEESRDKAEAEWDKANPGNICWVDDFEVFE